MSDVKHGELGPENGIHGIVAARVEDSVALLALATPAQFWNSRIIEQEDTNQLWRVIQYDAVGIARFEAFGAGDQGIQGLQGPTGDDGIQGIQGVPGVDGADGSIDIDITNAVDGDVLVFINGAFVLQTPIVLDASAITFDNSNLASIEAVSVQAAIEEVSNEGGAAPSGGSSSDYFDNTAGPLGSTAAWMMNEAISATEADDFVGDLQAVKSGSPVFAQSSPASANNAIGGAVQISPGNFLVVAHNALLNLGDDGKLGLAFWFQSTNATEYALISKKTTGGKGWVVRLSGSGQITTTVHDGTIQENLINNKSANLLNDGIWHHIGVNIDLDNNLLECVVDGGTNQNDNPDRLKTIAISPNQLNVDTAESLVFGDGDGRTCDAQMAGISIKVGGVFTLNQIESLYDGGVSA